MFCKDCGSEIEKDWIVCPNCGSRIKKEKEIEPETKYQEDKYQESKEYNLLGMRRTGRFSFWEIPSTIKVAGEEVQVITQGKKTTDSRFRKEEITGIDFPILPIWKAADIIRLTGFGLLTLLSYGLGIFAVLFSIKIALSRHLRLKLSTGQEVNIPIRQKADASDFLRELNYPEEEIAKNDAKRISEKKWALREWIVYMLLIFIAAFTLYLGLELRIDNMKNNDIVEEETEEGPEDFNGETEELFEEPEDISEDMLKEEEPVSDNAAYIFPDSDKKYLSEDEVRSITVEEMAVGRNEIFARHGYIFQDEGLRAYFESMPWYEGRVPSEGFQADAVFNDFEKKNVELIKRVEDEINGVNVQQANDFVLSEGVYVNDRILGDSLAFLTVNYASVDWMEVHLFPEEEYNGLTLWGSKLDDKTVQVKEEYTGIVITLKWDNPREVTLSSSGTFTGMDSELFNGLTNAHYVLESGY